MLHSFVLQELQFILIWVIPNLCKQHQSIDLLLRVVSLLLWSDIVYIPHCWWHSLRVDDPSALLCIHVCILILFIILIFSGIFTWQYGRYNIVIYLVFWWVHSWYFHWVF